ncbi:MAG: alpha/beta fold hydrolase [Dermatophilaceae bacterium]
MKDQTIHDPDQRRRWRRSAGGSTLIAGPQRAASRSRAVTGASVLALVGGVGVVGLAMAYAAPASAVPAQAVSARTPPAQPTTGWGGLAGASAPAVPTIAWKACPDAAGVKCATVEVPTDYDQPDAGTTTIALAKLPATDPNARIGSVLLNPGGPGGSGVEAITTWAADFPASVRSRFDLVGFDPRGTNASDPATCFPTAAAESEFFTNSFDIPYDGGSAAEATHLAQVDELGSRCQATSPERLRHMSTANVARDMDVLRQAVGDAKLNFYGISYGTVLGHTYARLFPKTVRTLVLDGNIDPAEYTGIGDPRPIGMRTGQGRSFSETFDEFLRLCADGGANCALTRLGEPTKVVGDLMNRLLEGPVTVQPDGAKLSFTYDSVVVAIAEALYEPTAYPGLAELLAGIASADPNAVDRGATSLGLLAGLGTEDYVSEGGNLGVLCADTRPEAGQTSYQRFADQQNDRYGFFGRVTVWRGFGSGSACESWSNANRDADAYLGDWNQTTDAPVLVLNARYDPATAWQNAAPAAARFRTAQVLTVQGWGHTTLSAGSSCSVAVWAQYLIDGAIPTDAPKVCPVDQVPFQDGPATSPQPGTTNQRAEEKPTKEQRRDRERAPRRTVVPAPRPVG